MRLYNTIMMAIVACAAVLLPYGTAAAAACGVEIGMSGRAALLTMEKR